MRNSAVRFRFLLHLPHVMRIVVIVLLVALVAGGVFLGIRGCSSTKSTLSDGGIAISGVSTTSSFYAMGDQFIAFDGAYARAYNMKGELQWERSPDGAQGLNCAVSSSLLAMYRANTIYVYDVDGNVTYSGSVEQTIANVVAGQNAVAVRYEDDSIQVLDKAGKIMDTIVSTEGTVMDYGVYSGNDLMWVLLLNSDGIQPKSILNTYKPGKMLLAGYSTTDQMYVRPLFNSDLIYILGTKYLDVKNTTDASESSTLIYGWTLYDSAATSGGMNILLSLAAQGDAPTSLRVLVNGTKAVDLRMPAGCTQMVLGNDKVYGFAGQTIYTVPVAGGKTGSTSVPYSVDQVLCKLSENRALLSGNNQVWLVTLP